MRKLFIALMLFPLCTFAQTKNVINTTRVFPKIDKVDLFEKALAAHALKYHKGNWSWRVYAIQTGPDAGGYHIVEGPLTWDDFDSRGDLGQAHTDDWNKTIAIYLTEKNANSYSVYIDSLSTIPLTTYTDKIIVTHVFPKVGYGPQYIDHIKKIKKTWEAGNQSVAVYQSVISGRTGYTFVGRLKDGLKEMNDSYRKPFRERYETGNGVGSFDGYLNNQRTIVNDESWSELLIYQPKLSSPSK